jgi:hypothetical protein
MKATTDPKLQALQANPDMRRTLRQTNKAKGVNKAVDIDKEAAGWADAAEFATTTGKKVLDNAKDLKDVLKGWFGGKVAAVEKSMDVTRRSNKHPRLNQALITGGIATGGVAATNAATGAAKAVFGGGKDTDKTRQ